MKKALASLLAAVMAFGGAATVYAGAESEAAAGISQNKNVRNVSVSSEVRERMNNTMGSLDYVVLHELCHLLARGHGPAFKALLDAHMPDWRERRAMLR